MKQNFPIEKRYFDKTPKGEEVSLFTLKNELGLEARIINFGGAIQSLFVPNSKGELADVVLGFNDIETYLKENLFGAIVGRIAGRLTGGGFTIDGQKYSVANNEGNVHLHGGNEGFDKKVW